MMSENPYEAPPYADHPADVPSPATVAPQTAMLGAFVLTILIMDLVFCVLRLVLGLVGVSGYADIPQDDPLRGTIFLESVSAVGIGVFGILANMLIYSMKRIGIPLSAIPILFTVLNMLAGVWLGYLQIPADLDALESIAFLLPAILGVAMRLVLLVFYVAAILGARKRLAELSAA